jgi:O-methyltransferase involved in polyketide biosynthesis
MKEKKTWRSAEAAAAARACESMQPSHLRLFYDPWAKYFLSFKYSSFRFVAENSGGGSSIIFDYPDISFIREPEQSKEAATLHRYHARIGEPPLFGIDKNRIDDFLSKRGLSLIKTVSVESLGPIYFGTKNNKIKISPFFHILHAAV